MPNYQHISPFESDKTENYNKWNLFCQQSISQLMRWSLPQTHTEHFHALALASAAVIRLTTCASCVCMGFSLSLAICVLCHELCYRFLFLSYYNLPPPPLFSLSLSYIFISYTIPCQYRITRVFRISYYYRYTISILQHFLNIWLNSVFIVIHRSVSPQKPVIEDVLLLIDFLFPFYIFT